MTAAVPRDEVLAEDRRARRLAQTELERPLLLEAGAGTGKTTTLVARILAWCLGPGWRRHAGQAAERRREQGRSGDAAAPPADEVAAAVLERVVAITFTEDAAAEMAQRVARELAALARPDAAPPDWLHLGDLDAPERARRAAALLATLDRLVVRTIHAFCRGLLADHPLEARLHPDLAVDADGLLLEEVARETVEANLRRFYGAGAEPGNPYLELAARGIGPRELVEALVVLSQAGLPAAALDDDPLAPARFAELRRRLLAACRAVDAVVAPRRSGFGGRMRKAPALADAVAAAVRRLEDAAPPSDLPALAELLAELLPDDLCDHLAKWQTWSGLGKAEQAALDGARDALAAAAGELRALLRHVAALDPELLVLGHRALAPLHKQVRGELRARGIVTFEDLLVEAAHLLAARPDVAARARAGIEQLLVDEFQDTDALQCEIVARLGLEGPDGERPGLFLVGDPKQSIYGWRSADLAAYDAFRRRVEAAGGLTLPLAENFRSVPAILDEVARAVAPVMVDEPGLQPPYQPLLACARRAADPGFTSEAPGRAAVEHWVSWRGGADTAKAASYEVEADAIARDLRHLHDAHGLAWEDAALLLRSTSDLDVYLEALRRHGVPFAVGRDKQYYRRREVIDAAALVRAILDPGDHLALLTVLRSPWVGVPDAALVPLWNRGFPDRLTALDGPDPRLLAEVRERVGGAAEEVAGLPAGAVPGLDRVAGWDLSLVAAVEQVAAVRRGFRELPADAFVDLLRELFLPEPLAAARYLGAYRLANLERFFRRLLAALEEGGGDVTAVLRALRRSVAEAREAPEGKPREGADDAVQVMTIHQAKGLDFAHVYLPQLHKEAGGPPSRTEVQRVEVDGGAGFEMRLFGAPSLGWDLVEAQRQKVEAAERVRLLYVAMTRAESRLVMAGCWDGEVGKPREVARARHFLDLLGHREGLPRGGVARWWENDPRRQLGEGGDGLRSEASTGGGPGSARLPITGDGAPEPVAEPDGTRSGEAGGRGSREGGADAFVDPAGVLWRFPVRTRWPEAVRREADAVEAPDPRRVAAGSRELARRVAAAAGRQARPFSAPASEEAHHLLRQAMEGEWRDGAGGGERALAMAVGTAIHRLLEEADLAAGGAGLAAARGRLPALLAAAGGLGEQERRLALADAETLLAGLAAGPLPARLAELAPHVVARELPVLLAAPQVAPAEAAAAAAAPSASPPPVAFLSGAVDLLYRDPESGELVVADYKTDQVDDEAALRARALLYASQGRTYAEALRRALDLPRPPRFELWFLRAGRVVSAAVEPPVSPAAGPRQISLFDLG
jgi:ATP-dependent helicase/nuclease subunit A